MISNNTKSGAVDMKLEVVLLQVSDVDRAKAFYENLGWRVDIDIAGGDFRGVQVTPHNSEASIIFGKGTNLAKPGSANLVLAVDNIDAARAYLVARGVDVSEVFHYAAGPFNDTVENPRGSAGAIRKVVLTSRLHRSRIRMGTVGCSRRSRRDFPVASGNHNPSTLQTLQSSCTKRPNITTITRRRMASTTGGIGTRPT
jgi:predicted enzyme related to lactoylglutathione lyase